MQDHGANDVNKAAIKTALKCGIPVAALGVFGLIVFFNPEASWSAMGVIFYHFLSGLTIAFHGASKVLRTMDSAIVPIEAIVILTFLWSACALNHLKAKGLTGDVYVKLARVFTACLVSVLVTAGLAFLIWVSMISQRSYEESTLWFLTWSGVLVIAPIALYTLDNNKEIFADEGVDK